MLMLWCKGLNSTPASGSKYSSLPQLSFVTVLPSARTYFLGHKLKGIWIILSSFQDISFIALRDGSFLFVNLYIPKSSVGRLYQRGKKT